MANDPIVIRYATIAEAAKIATLFKEVVQDLEIYNEEARRIEIEKNNEVTFRARLGDDPRSISVAARGDAMLGFCITTDQHGPIWIEWYGVSKAARREGLGTKLVTHLQSELPRRHATKIWCDSRTINLPTIRLFEGLGFRRLCELKEHWYGQDFYLWEWTLQ